jgi:hypothetical protein
MIVMFIGAVFVTILSRSKKDYENCGSKDGVKPLLLTNRVAPQDDERGAF